MSIEASSDDYTVEQQYGSWLARTAAKDRARDSKTRQAAEQLKNGLLGELLSGLEAQGWKREPVPVSLSVWHAKDRPDLAINLYRIVEPDTGDKDGQPARYQIHSNGIVIGNSFDELSMKHPRAAHFMLGIDALGQVYIPGNLPFTARVYSPFTQADRLKSAFYTARDHARVGMRRDEVKLNGTEVSSTRIQRQPRF